MKSENEIIQAARQCYLEAAAILPEHAKLIQDVPCLISRRLTRTLGQVKFLGTMNWASGVRVWTPLRLELSWAAFKHDANFPKLRDTVLHEIAHIVAGRMAEHNGTWEALAVKLGAEPTACGSVPVSPVKPIKLVEVLCNRCQNPLTLTSRKAAMHRNGTRKYIHKKCLTSQPSRLY